MANDGPDMTKSVVQALATIVRTIIANALRSNKK